MVANSIERAAAGFPWRIAAWSAAAALLALPAVAMRFTREVVWTAEDFAAMGAMLLIAGLAIEGLVRASRSLPYRLGAAVAVLAGFLLVWVNLAVGFLGDEGNPANLMFLAVLAVAAGGAVLTRVRPAGMARTMLAAAAVQMLVAGFGFSAGMGSPGSAGVFEVVMGSTLFGGLWLAAAALFGKAARDAERSAASA
ncbi:MAG: hypothetical protein LC648_07535 [Novosphingobium sp.]|nr:hypothetical protein [Novosphingobium sp.]